MASLASTYRNQGELKDSEDLGVLVMKSMEWMGDEHPDTLTSMDSLAHTYTNHGLRKEAEELGLLAGDED